MRVLALDTTTTDGSLAIADERGCLVEMTGDRQRSHTARLPGDVHDLLARAALSSRDIDLFAVVSGPGSFTGLRTGIATIQGLAMVHGRRVVAVSALEALGMAASERADVGSRVAAWMDAHRRDVFSALFEVGPGDSWTPDRLRELDAATVDTPANTLARWDAAGIAPTVVAGDGATLYHEMLDARAVVMPHPPLASIAARMALARARQGLTIDPAAIQPVYVRRPDVEVTRDARRASESAPPPTPSAA